MLDKLQWGQDCVTLLRKAVSEAAKSLGGDGALKHNVQWDDTESVAIYDPNPEDDPRYGTGGAYPTRFFSIGLGRGRAIVSVMVIPDDSWD